MKRKTKEERKDGINNENREKVSIEENRGEKRRKGKRKENITIKDKKDLADGRKVTEDYLEREEER